MRLNRINDSSTKSVIKNIDSLHAEFINNKLIPEKVIWIEERNDSDLFLEGEWKGEILIYDWSGKEIVFKKSVSTVITQNGYLLQIDWNSNLTHNSSKGIVLGNNVNFETLQLVTEDALGGYTLKNVSNLSLILKHTDCCTYISGNVETYLPEKKEPGPPTFIVLKRIKNVSETSSDIPVELDLETKDFF